MEVTVAHVPPISEYLRTGIVIPKPTTRRAEAGDAAAMAALGMDVEDDGKGKGSSREALVKEVLLCLRG